MDYCTTTTISNPLNLTPTKSNPPHIFQISIYGLPSNEGLFTFPVIGTGIVVKKMYDFHTAPPTGHQRVERND